MIQLEGTNPVQEALKLGKITKIMVEKGREKDPKIAQLIETAKQRDIQIETAPRFRMRKIALTKNYQGIIGLAEDEKHPSIDAVLRKKKDVCILILDQVQDPQNLGAILRTAEATEVDGVILPKKGSASVTATVHRVSMGGSLVVPVWNRSLFQEIKKLSDEDVKLVGVDPSGSKPYFSEDLTGPIAFAIGGENRGVSTTVLSKCDVVVNIPMLGNLKSLNVSVATAIVLYERMRQIKTR